MNCLDDAYNKLLKKNRYAKPTELFKIAFYYYLSPKTLLTIKTISTEKQLLLLLETIITNYNKSVLFILEKW